MAPPVQVQRQKQLAVTPQVTSSLNYFTCACAVERAACWFGKGATRMYPCSNYRRNECECGLFCVVFSSRMALNHCCIRPWRTGGNRERPRLASASYAQGRSRSPCLGTKSHGLGCRRVLCKRRPSQYWMSFPRQSSPQVVRSHVMSFNVTAGSAPSPSVL